MTGTDLRAYYGLKRPYNFAVALPFLVCVATILFVFLLTGVLGLNHAIEVQSSRFLFLCYVVAIFLSAILLLRVRWLAFGLMLLGFLELGLGGGTAIGHRLGLLRQSVLPSNEVTPPEPFTYHPLLGGVPIKGYVSRSGLDVRHNSFGMRGQEINVRTGKPLITVFGGSTTYDLGVPNGATWVEQLQRNLGYKYVIANFGVPGYSSSEHVIQTAFYNKLNGILPKCSIYYMGWNDIRSAHLPNLDDAYADFHLLAQIDNLKVRRRPYASFSPLYTVASGYLSARLDTIPYAPPYRNLAPLSGSDRHLEEIYARNARSLISLNDAQGIKSIFIGQILNRERLISENVYGWLPRVRDMDVWPLQERFNQVLKDEASRLNAVYIPVDVTEFANADFVDKGHFSEAGARKFAHLIAEAVQRHC